MRYYATIDDQTYEINIEATGRVTVDGVEVSADMRRIGQTDLYSLLLDNVSHEAYVQADGDQPGAYAVLVAGSRYPVKVQDERARRMTRVSSSLQPPSAELIIKAPISGLVIKVLAAPNQAVREGEPLVILEAMKMENELRAPRTGAIHEVRVAPGNQVATGQVLMTLR